MCSHEQPNTDNSEIRIVLLGKTGAGKSASGNTILGIKAFKSKLSFSSITNRCEGARGEVKEQKLVVVDTPGLFDTEMITEENVKEITQCIFLSAPGPHVFLVVIKLGRFTEEEQKSVEMIQKVFGEEAAKYTMILFTHGDLLEDEPNEFFVSNSPDLQALVAKCSDYHVFNNKASDESQVTELLKKINNMVLKNGGGHYTTAMFQEAERAIEEEKQRILTENDEKRQKMIEELENKYRGEALEKAKKEMKEQQEREARDKAGQKIQSALVGVAIGLPSGLYTGIFIGMLAGPVGVLVGSVVGIVVGVLSGGVAGALKEP